MKKFPFTQYEIEKAIAAPVKHGDIDKIAKSMNALPAYVQHWVNPNNPRKSPAYNFIRFLYACDRIGIGDHLVTTILMWRQVWLQKSARAQPEAISICIANVLLEISDFVRLKIEGAAPHDLLLSSNKLRSTAECLVDAVNFEFTRQGSSSPPGSETIPPGGVPPISDSRDVEH